MAVCPEAGADEVSAGLSLGEPKVMSAIESGRTAVLLARDSLARAALL